MDNYQPSLYAEAHMFRARCPEPSMDTSFKVDEGYSEETRSQDGSNTPSDLDLTRADMASAAISSMARLPQSVLTLNEAQRSEFAYNVLLSLRTSSIAAIVERLRPLLHIDPVAALPPEVTSEIFAYLEPSMLLDASRVSRAWRDRTLDSRLWKQKFQSEGWGLDMEEVRRFEREAQSAPANMYPKTKSRRAETQVERRQSKRARAGADADINLDSSRRIRGHLSHRGEDVGAWNEQHGQVEADHDHERETPAAGHDEEMQDVGTNVNGSALQDEASSSHPHDTPLPLRCHGMYCTGEDPTDRVDITNHLARHAAPREAKPTSLVLDPPLIIPSSSKSPRLNFHNVYKQKRRLEDNWNAGRFTPFQLPHRDHPEEAHIECVYTVQYLGKYLVSGSRDRTLRIWDLETQRLVRKPLLGHSGSVLCLQFDDSKEEDIIISGSSDTDVILWRFSTGEMIKQIRHAHRESVLNLKFDNRFLVTCSKDKTIKIWSRHALRPSDANYPVRGLEGGGNCPSYIVDLSKHGIPGSIESSFTPQQQQPLEPYTLLMMLDDHGAAVNAIHIYKDQLVSASGDRSLRLWDIHTGVCTARCEGHTKGIACVQYDGKRIVSGSSDNTIRIYDPATQAEVACLQGHTRLVRTVQAAFGDYPGKREALEDEALAIDRQYFEAIRSGAISTGKPLARTSRTRERNAGSMRPEDIMAYGAKLPPGGGGSRWGRIISGSYDETVIIWKKMPDGRWVIGHELRQEAALRAAGGPLLAWSDVQARTHLNNHLQAQQNQDQPSAHQGGTMSTSHANGQTVGQASHHPPQAPQTPQAPASQPTQMPIPAHQNVQQAMQTGAAALQTGIQNVAALNNHLNNMTQSQVSPSFQNVFPNAQYRHYYQQIAAANANLNFFGTPIPNPGQSNPAPAHPAHPPAAPNAAPHAANAPAAATAGTPQPNARVFKLQFDARRIICCSQDPKIVGWDFANGDEKIIECSRFFAPPT
ncbi:MAG: hypothetical protein FRX48_05264 [Lasallia pustulata]|uniref:F-box domain-containing protein n=1 Tax=Lasallia pustulata TaxID=136370 RepID=A0A5M8PNC0_9LECA|nr:MAG: hypothetical protein FRX48_05264 [Lasallia pustulata]